MMKDLYLENQKATKNKRICGTQNEKKRKKKKKKKNKNKKKKKKKKKKL